MAQASTLDATSAVARDGVPPPPVFQAPPRLSPVCQACPTPDHPAQRPRWEIITQCAPASAPGWGLACALAIPTTSLPHLITRPSSPKYPLQPGFVTGASVDCPGVLGHPAISPGLEATRWDYLLTSHTFQIFTNRPGFSWSHFSIEVVIGSHTDCILQQLVVSMTTNYIIVCSQCQSLTVKHFPHDLITSAQQLAVRGVSKWRC